MHAAAGPGAEWGVRTAVARSNAKASEIDIRGWINAVSLEEFVPVRRTILVVIPIALAVLTAACGSGSKPASSAAPGAQLAAAPKTAEQVVTAITGKIPTVKLVRTLTAADDANHLLGRPNGYTSKTAFSDSRLPADQLGGTAADSGDRGGSVEVFADGAGAKARMDYIQAIGKSAALFAEYDYANGPILVRVSKLLTPDQAKEYEAATKAVTG